MRRSAYGAAAVISENVWSRFEPGPDELAGGAIASVEDPGEPQIDRDQGLRQFP